MKLAVVGSRGLKVRLEDYIPEGVTEIVSGGAVGIDACARRYAMSHKLKLTEFRPDYGKFGKTAPLRRNIDIITYSDEVLAIWDGSSRGTWFVIDRCIKIGKKVIVKYVEKSEAANTRPGQK